MDAERPEQPVAAGSLEPARSPAESPEVLRANSWLRPALLRRLLRWALVALAIYVVGWFFLRAGSALVPFILGLFLAYLFLPLVNRLDRDLPRWAAILIVYFGGFAAVFVFFSFIVPPLVEQIGALVRQLRAIDLQMITSMFDLVEQRYEELLAGLPENIRVQIQEGVQNGINQAITTLQSNLTTYLQEIGTFLVTSTLQVINTVTFLLGFVLVPFFLFYVLLDQRAGLDTLDQLLPRALRRDFWTVATIIDYVLSGYIRGQLFLGFVVGLMAGLGLVILNLFGFEVNYILLLAVIAGVTELVPIIGPILGAVPAIVLGFFDSPATGIAVTVLYIAIQQLENNLLVPRIVGDSVDIHPAMLMLLLVVFGQVFGLLGIILSAPVTAVARDVFSYIYARLGDPPRPAGLLPDRLIRQIVDRSQPDRPETVPEDNDEQQRE